MLCRFICDKRLTYLTYIKTIVIYGFVWRVFIYMLNSNSYFTVTHRLSDAWLLYRHCKLFTATFQSFPLFSDFSPFAPNFMAKSEFRRCV